MFLSATGDFDETMIANEQPNVAFHPSFTPQQHNLLEGEEDIEGAGRGERNRGTVEGQGVKSGGGPPPQSAKAFFAQLDWRAGGGDTGYAAYETDSDSDDSSSSDEEDEMFNGGPGPGQPQLNMGQPLLNLGQPLLNHNHMVHVYIILHLCTYKLYMTCTHTCTDIWNVT